MKRERGTSITTENPFSPEDIGVTIKVPESEKWAGDNPWFTFKGTDADSIKNKIIAVFGLDDSNADLSLFEVTLNAQRIATSVGKAAQSLGGTILPTAKSSAKGSSASVAAPEAEAQPDAPHPLFAMIEEQKSIPDLQNLWARNKAEFDSTPDLMAAYKAKGKALS